ncbi:MAG TPA: alpha/beta hydrolase [Solirubrobacteraceae bacterium]|nr:alpha/beta hydrolase [Solirubrobacteraceae bacterium]
MRVADVGGVRIAYRLEGRGPPLVLLHGAVSDSRSWRPQIEGLAGAFTVVAWDAPGSGRSPDPAPPFGTDEWAGALAGLLDALSLGPAHVVGLSWGATIALALAAARPDRVASLVLAGGYAGWKGSLPPEECAARLAMALETAALPPAELADLWLPSLVSDDAAPARVAELRAVVEDAHPEGLRLMARSLAETDLRPALGQIDVPVLLLWGGRDVRSPLAVAEALRRAMPHAELVVIPGAGHVANVERPEEFTAAVRRFCSAVR